MHTVLKTASLWSTLRRLPTHEYNGKSLAVSGRDHSRYQGAESHDQIACQRARRYRATRVCGCVHRSEAHMERSATGDTRVQRRMCVIILRTGRRSVCVLPLWKNQGQCGSRWSFPTRQGSTSTYSIMKTIDGGPRLVPREAQQS